ncbi:type II toxin-antitoxin system VapC family toxin [Paenibacillus doosanensis]|uniref:type II toxin-antitoxin system VapC family toxin n=1 Tax=Paenibacillus doosanensis TaxID=1229154 RepID=UPI00218097E4|nr:PIN domain-containing protein [Paenibacillus doosanensis]
MTNGYLLDTNIAIAIFMNEGNVVDFSTITECEVFAGLKPEEQLLAEKLFTTKRCIDITSDIAKLAGTIRRDQKGKGRKLKTPDALIIATALASDLILVSRDADMSFVQSELEVPLLKI